MRKISVMLILVLPCLIAIPQKKKPLDHSIYEDWKELYHSIISDDGRFDIFEINPQKGDGFLIIRDLKKDENDTVPRGYIASFSNDFRFVVGNIKPPLDSTLAAKKEKKNDDDLPQWMSEGAPFINQNEKTERKLLEN